MCIHDRNRFPGKFFYILDICLLFNVAEGNSPSVQPGPSGSSDAVDICLRDIEMCIRDSPYPEGSERRMSGA